jgi:hypothetical protein
MRALGKIEINGRRYADGETLDPRDEAAAKARGWAQADAPRPAVKKAKIVNSENGEL